MSTQDVTSGSVASQMKRLRSDLYHTLGENAISKAAERLGIERTHISHVLSHSKIEVVDQLERLIKAEK